MYQLRLDEQLVQKYPNYTALILYATNLTNSVSDTDTLELLRSTEQIKRTEFGDTKPTANPHIAAWREAYQSFGAKPSKYPCSVEALLSRVLKDQALPSINQIVDLYNVVSLKYVLPIGGEDWDKLSSDLFLTFASGEESFDTFREGTEVIDHPAKGEVIWKDSTGVTCRAWNWRQGLRTRLTLDTTNAYFVLDSLSPFSLATLEEAAQDLIQLLKAASPQCSIRQEILGKHA